MGKTIVVQQVGCERAVPEGAARNRGGRVRLAAPSMRPKPARIRGPTATMVRSKG
ncbi:MAG TPA: hypothetical protein VE993_10225 [Stellaceae bacterium]|nr:hypothetical protein [Stellaceae bacterium]